MKTILIIEDDIVLRETTAEILELEGYKVVVAANGKRGIEQARIMLPDIIICDIMMPELDGYDVFKLLSEDETTKKIPFIFMSAKTEIKDIRKGMDLGADDYLTKPFSVEELQLRISALLKRIQIVTEKPDNAIVQIGEYTFDTENFALKHERFEKTLTKKIKRINNID